jgi:hypothetical protein
VGAGDTLVGADNAVLESRVEQAMTKEIEIHGRRVKLYSLDEGRTWSSSPQSIVAYGQRKTMLRLDLQKSFEGIDVMPDSVEAVFHPVRR